MTRYNGDGTAYNPDAPEEPATSEPSTPTILDIPQMIPQDHQWVQVGARHIEDICPTCPRTGVTIPDGTTLIKDEKGYRLVLDAEAVRLKTRS